MNEIICLSVGRVGACGGSMKKYIEIKVEDGALSGFNVSLTIH